jgi:hypothetical protein
LAPSESGWYPSPARPANDRARAEERSYEAAPGEEPDSTTREESGPTDETRPADEARSTDEARPAADEGCPPSKSAAKAAASEAAEACASKAAETPAAKTPTSSQTSSRLHRSGHQHRADDDRCSERSQLLLDHSFLLFQYIALCCARR